jgi:hypothetical protein
MARNPSAVNRSLLLMGLFLALVGAAGVFVMGFIFAPPPTLVVAAREAIPAGSNLADIPDDLFVRLPVRGDRQFLAAYVSEGDLGAMRAAGAVLIGSVAKFEAIPKSIVVSDANDAASRISALALGDPDLVAIVVPAVNAPDGIREGDRVDLAIAVDELMASMDVYMPPLTIPDMSDLSALDYAYLYETDVVTPVMVLASPTPAPSPTPTLTPTPPVNAPLAKIIVHNAKVLRVVREQAVTTVGSDTGQSVVYGDVIGLELVIPRDAFEMVAMAAEAGSLQIALLSPLADDTYDAPTMGATMDDLIDLFRAEREMLKPAGEEPATPTPASTLP